ncbi:MAG: OB-fold domain-containing protein [Nocardioides sp.]
MSGRGTVDSWTAVQRAPRPDVVVPYTIVRIRLDEGPILLSVLDDPPGAPEPTLGMPVVAAWTDLPDGRALPVFISHTREA